MQRQLLIFLVLLSQSHLSLALSGNKGLIKITGFSKDGHMAYSEKNPNCVCQKGRCSQIIPLCGYDNEPAKHSTEQSTEQCRKKCLPEDSFLVDLRNDTFIKLESSKAKDLQKFAIRDQTVQLTSLPFKHADDVFSAEFSKGCQQIGNLEAAEDKTFTCSIILVSRKLGRKTIHSLTSKLQRGFTISVIGVATSPFEDRAAILVQQVSRPFEDEGISNLFFIGAHLAQGFSEAKK